MIFIDFFDRSQHEISRKETKNNIIISYNLLLITLEGIKLGLLSTKSLDILTWQQLRGSETAYSLFMSLE